MPTTELETLNLIQPMDKPRRLRLLDFLITHR